MMTRSSRLPREGLERAAHELAGLSLTTTELEAARPFHEKQLLRVAHAYERSHPWLDRRPLPV